MTKTYIPEIEDDIDTLAVTVSRHLSHEEISRLSGCIGYALRVHIAGEDLSDPVAIVYHAGMTTVSYWYDSTKSQRSDRDVQGALEQAAEMIRTGTPVRKSNRAGAGTAGTRLVEGLGEVNVAFEVNIDPEDPFIAPLPPADDVTSLVIAAQRLEAARAEVKAAEVQLAQATRAVLGGAA